MSAVLLQISDPHFGTEREEVVEALAQLAQAQAPQLIVMSGDITQRARASQFAAARRFVDRLAAPSTLVIPGNHDIPLYNVFARLFRPYGNHQAAFGSQLEPEFESDHLLVIALNTTRWYRHENGEVSAAQIERVAARLASARPGQLRVVVTHQPIAVTKPQDDKNLLIGHREAVRAWAAAGADLVLGGHIHLPFVVPLHRRHEGLAKTIWAVQAGTALSHRVRHGADNSVNIVRYAGLVDDRRQVTIERWDFDAATRRLRCVKSDELQVQSLGRR